MSLTSFRILWQILSISQVEILNNFSANNRSRLPSHSAMLSQQVTHSLVCLFQAELSYLQLNIAEPKLLEC